MIPHQYLHRDPVAISYPIDRVGHGTGAVTDPLYPIEPYIHDAAERTPIRFVIDTHPHAAHVSAGRTLAVIAGALKYTRLAALRMRSNVEGRPCDADPAEVTAG